MSSKTKAKVVLVGDSRAGKSCLLAAFASEDFEATYSPTVGVNFKARTLRIDDGDGHSATVKLTLWDSAGEGQNYQAIQSTYYKGARCAVIVFDVTSRESFQNVEHWMSEVAKYAEGPMPVVLVATKGDLRQERVVTAEDAEEWAAEQPEVIPVHEVSSKDGTNIEELVMAIGGMIARSALSQTSISSKRDSLKATAVQSMSRQQTQPPPSISPPAQVSSTPAQPHHVESAAGDVSQLELRQGELQLLIEQQENVVAEAKAAAMEVGGRVGELESAFGTLQQNFESVLQKLVAQQREDAETIATLQQSTEAHEAQVQQLSQDSQARGQRNEKAMSSIGAELAELTAVTSRMHDEVQRATENNQQTDGRLKVVEEAVLARERNHDTPPPVDDGGMDSANVTTQSNMGVADRAEIVAEIEGRMDTLLADAQQQQVTMLQAAEGRLREEVAGLLREGLSSYESRLGAVEEELAECHLESAGQVQEARSAAKACATVGVAKAVEQAAQLLQEEVRRLEAEWESRMADLATDFETAAMLGGGSSQVEAEERVTQLSKELSAAKASLAVNKTELELQQGEIALLTNRADSAEEENAELRARMDKLQSMLLAMGDSPFASPATGQEGGVASTHGRIGTGLADTASPAHFAAVSTSSNVGRQSSAADVSLRFDQSMKRTTTEESEADLMGTVNFNASYGDMSPIASPHVGADLSSSDFVLGRSSKPDFAPQVQGVVERPWPSQRRASRDLGGTLDAPGGTLTPGDRPGIGEDAAMGATNQSSPTRRPRTAPPGWHEELERMLSEEKNESTAAMEAFAQSSQRRLSFRSSKRRQVTPSDGTLRGYIRHCYDGCDDEPEMDQMREELRRMVEMFAAAGKIATTDWMTLPPPI